MKKIVITAVLLFSLFVPGAVSHAQSLTTASAGGGNRVALGFGMAGSSFEGLFIDTGTVIEDYLYLGVGWNLKYGDLGGSAMQQSMIRGVCSLPVLSQDEVMPVSFLLTGVYEKINSTGDYLDASELIRTGTGFKAAVDMYRDFPFGEGLVLRTDLSGIYSSGVLLTESAVGAETEVSPTQERYSEYLYGFKLGILYTLEDRLGLGVTVNGHLDGAFGVHYGVIFSIFSPSLE